MSDLARGSEPWKCPRGAAKSTRVRWRLPLSAPARSSSAASVAGFKSSLDFCDQLMEYSRCDLNHIGLVKAKFMESWKLFEHHPRSEMGTVTLQPVNSPPRRLSNVAMRSGPAPLFLAPRSNRRSSGSSPLLRAAVRYSGGSTLQEIVCCYCTGISTLTII